MENFRSMSVREGRMQIDKQPSSGLHYLRSFSTSYATISSQKPTNNIEQKVVKLKKSKSKSASSSSKNNWSLSDPEIQRKKRVASYKVYAVEGKMKGSIRKSFRWIKDTCSQAVYGWR